MNRKSSGPATKKSTTGTPTAPTRNTRRTHTEGTKDSTTQDNIHNAQSAKAWLLEHNLLESDESIELKDIVTALLSIADGDNESWEHISNGVKATAICIQDIDEKRTIKEAVKELRRVAAETVEGAKAHMEEVQETTRRMMGEAEERLKKILEGKGHDDTRQNQALEKVAEALEKTQTYADVLARANTNGNNARGGNEQIDYDYKARETLRRKQVLIDGVEGIERATEGLAPKEIVAKANLAIEKMRLEEGMEEEVFMNTGEGEVRCVAAKVLKNGGVVLEMATEEVAEWIKGEKGKKAFVESFGASAMLKERAYSIVVEFIPAGCRETLEGSLAEIENENRLPKGTIARVRWMRNPKHWRRDQSAAHAVVVLYDRTKANKILRDGLLVAGMRRLTRKLEEDPKRCFKCQFVNPGHTAATCKSINDICPNCAGCHAGGECRASRAQFTCVSCRKEKRPHNHAAWDRYCPTMLLAKTALRKRIVENNYRYWPEEGVEWTWTKVEEDSEEAATGRWRGRQEGRRMESLERLREEMDKVRITPDNGYGGRLGGFTIGDIGVRGAKGRKEAGRTQRTDMPPPSQTPTMASTSTQSRSKSRGRRAATGNQTQEREPSRQSQLDDWVQRGRKGKEVQGWGDEQPEVEFENHE